MQENKLKELIFQIQEEPLAAHGLFFKHRHPQASAKFHARLLTDWYSPHPYIAQAVFRGGAKSTLGEEAVCLTAALSLAKNILIIGASFDRAKERLDAVKNEYETNEYINDIFGDIQGSTWGATQIVLKNKTSIRALGWDQSMRGIKHLNWRPDLAWIDDVEDEENVKDEDTRAKIIKRLLSVIFPAIDAPGHRIRGTGSILSPDSLIPKLSKLPSWIIRKYPVRRINPTTGAWEASWPERKPLQEIDRMIQDYTILGQYDIFEREYMCEASTPTTQKFYPENMIIKDIRRTFEPTYVIYDPARTTNEKTSAHTGKVVISWSNNKLIVWESSGNFWSPADIINDIISSNEKYSPIYICIERDGLEEFILQPIRHKQLSIGTILPILPVRAPKGKRTFIRALQPFFAAHEVIFTPDAEAHAELTKQLLNFPSGRIDVPNALAYALQLKLGQPLFDTFSYEQHIVPPPTPTRLFPLVLALNSDKSYTAGILLQLVRGQWRVLHDFVAEGSPDQSLADIVGYVRALTPSIPLTCIAPPCHFSPYDTIGLRAAAASVPIRLKQGGDITKGLQAAQEALSSLAHAHPRLVVSTAATWTLRALSGGLTRTLDRKASLQPDPAASLYSVLAECLFTTLANPPQNPLDISPKTAYTKDGTPYLSARR